MLLTRPSRNITSASRSCGGCKRRCTPDASVATTRRIVLNTFPHLPDRLRASIPASHASVISRRRLACRTTVMAPGRRKRLRAPLAEARREVLSFIEGFCNTRRLNLVLDYRSPANFEKLNHAA